MKYFPYSEIRDGQREFLNDVTKALHSKSHLLANAPTGMGKTVAVLFSALRFAMKNDKLIIFLTSRKSQHIIVIDELKKIYNEVLKFRAVDLISKKDMCLRNIPKSDYNIFYEICKYYMSKKLCTFYNNENDDILDFIQNNIIHSEDLIDICRQSNICPYKYAEKALRGADIVVCDINYFFSDIYKYIKSNLKYDLKDTILIIDEGHNLSDRVRGCNEVEITIENLNLLRKVLTTSKGRGLIYKLMINLINTFGDSQVAEPKLNKEWFDNFLFIENINYQDFIKILDLEKSISKDSKILSMISKIQKFIQTWEGTNDEYLRRFIIKEKKLKISILDISQITNGIFDSVYSSVTMSGTLDPLMMYIDIFNLQENRVIMNSYDNPFPKENRKFFCIDDVDTLQNNRNRVMYLKFANYIQDIIIGNCNVLLFFTSYKMLYNISMFVKTDKFIIKEKKNTTPEEKHEIIKTFETNQHENGIILFGVFGGSYSEGIDFKNIDKVIIVGFPRPPPTVENEELKKFYVAKFGYEKAEDYTYINTAINKVKQAYGRMIRSKSDKGQVYLLDKRYSLEKYGDRFDEDF